MMGNENSSKRQEYEFECSNCGHLWYIELPAGNLRKDAGAKCPVCYGFCEDFKEIK